MIRLAFALYVNIMAYEKWLHLADAQVGGNGKGTGQCFPFVSDTLPFDHGT